MKDNKIRFLATGDIHSDLKLINKIKNSKGFNSIDFIVLIGDLSDKNNDFKKLLDIFKDKNIFMVPGNHETKKNLEILKNVYNIHLVGNSPAIINENLAFFGSNYIGVGPYSLSEEEILENLIENYNAVSSIKCKIHLSHIPPSHTRIGNASSFFPLISGSDAIRAFLERFNPDITLVGHIHESSGLEEIVNKTKIVNVGRTFKIFVFDPKTNKIKIINKLN